jgi:hypothetical protein
MRLFGALAVLALVTAPVATAPLLIGPASAQMMNLMPEVKTRTPEEKERDAMTDKAYRDSLRQIPDNKSSVDPWGNVRSDAPKAAAPKQPRTKTGSAH